MTVNANDELQFRMTVNNVVEPKSLMRQQFSNGNYQAISYSFLRDFTTGDNIRFEVRDITASNKILTTDNKNIVVLRVG
jgi:hypothetical protein